MLACHSPRPLLLACATLLWAATARAGDAADDSARRAEAAATRAEAAAQRAEDAAARTERAAERLERVFEELLRQQQKAPLPGGRRP